MRLERICVALVTIGMALGVVAGCDTVKKVFEDDGTKNPNYLADIDVYDAEKQTDIPVKIEVTSGESSEVKAAVKDVQNKDWDFALEKVTHAVKEDPSNAKAWWIKGLLHEHKGEWEKAIEAFKQSNIAKSSALAQDGRQRCQVKKDMSK